MVFLAISKSYVEDIALNKPIVLEWDVSPSRSRRNEVIPASSIS